MTPQTMARFADLFAGRTDAYGTGLGGVVRKTPTVYDYHSHLCGVGPGLGIFPLSDDGTVRFAAIDIDKPDFELAARVADLLPGRVFIERSRSGNAHVLVFFAEPTPAWAVRGVMRAVLELEGERHVEVFPKQSKLLAGMVGNYLNLAYFGHDRPILTETGLPMPLSDFLEEAVETRQPAEVWLARARALGAEEPGTLAVSGRDFGEDPYLHVCAEHIVTRALSGEAPVRAGHRSVVYFSLAKQLLSWSEMDAESAWDLMQDVEAASPDRMAKRELRRIFDNAATGRWTSTGCDDPVFIEYAAPTCPIAHAR